MNKLEALNVVMEKQEHGVTVPMALKISVGGKWHTVTVDREDRDIQKVVRVLVMMMLRNEIGKIANRSKELKKASKDYTVHVKVEYWAGYLWKNITVRTRSSQDARVMAFILSYTKGQSNQIDQETVIALALANTELV